MAVNLPPPQQLSFIGLTVGLLYLSKGPSSFTSDLYLIPEQELRTVMIYIVYRFNKSNERKGYMKYQILIMGLYG